MALSRGLVGFFENSCQISNPSSGSHVHREDLAPLDTIPTGVGGLVRVFRLNLQKNKLSGNIPDRFGSLGLIILNLESNQLSGSIPDRLPSAAMTKLELSNNPLRGCIPSRFGSLVSMLTLFLTCTGLTGRIPDGIGGMTSLQILALYCNLLSGMLPDGMASMARLMEVQIDRNRLSGTIPATSALGPRPVAGPHPAPVVSVGTEESIQGCPPPEEGGQCCISHGDYSLLDGDSGGSPPLLQKGEC